MRCGAHPRANTESLMEYLNALDTQNTLPPAEITAVDRREAMFETMMLGLRMTDGVSERDFERMHGAALSQVYGPALERLAGDGLGAWSSGAPGRGGSSSPHAGWRCKTRRLWR